MKVKDIPLNLLVGLYTKTEEEIAWDIVMYAVKNIPSMTFRIKYYNEEDGR